jgi:cytoskeletal protein RodZ
MNNNNNLESLGIILCVFVVIITLAFLVMSLTSSPSPPKQNAPAKDVKPPTQNLPKLSTSSTSSTSIPSKTNETSSQPQPPLPLADSRKQTPAVATSIPIPPSEPTLSKSTTTTTPSHLHPEHMEPINKSRSTVCASDTNSSFMLGIDPQDFLYMERDANGVPSIVRILPTPQSQS